MRVHGTDHASPPLPVFEPLDSVRSRWKSIATSGIAYGLAIAWGILTIAGVVLLFDPGTPLAMRIGIVAISVTPWLAIPLILRHAQRTGRAMFDAMRVDRHGLHWMDRGRTVDSLRWDALTRAPHDGHDIDVTTLSVSMRGTRINRDVLVGWQDRGDVRRVDLYFRGGRLFHNVYANEGQLRARFLLGVRTFRPDLRINPSTYSRFAIEPDALTYEEDSWLTELIGWAAVTVFTAVVYIVTWSLVE